MAVEWYYRTMGDVIGPLTPKEMRQRALAGDITHDSPVRLAFTAFVYRKQSSDSSVSSVTSCSSLPSTRVANAPAVLKGIRSDRHDHRCGYRSPSRAGPGLLESIYQWALIKEIELRGLQASSEQRVRVEYKGFIREEPLRFDILIEDCLLIEVKAVEAVHPIHKAQLLSYMRLLDVPLGLILNFHQEKLVDGVSRLILPSANR